jgi:cytochrome c2
MKTAILRVNSAMSFRTAVVALVAALFVVKTIAVDVGGSAKRGKDVFQEQCSLCHSVMAGDEGNQGPALNGVVGRRAGSVPGYSYSKSMRASSQLWTKKSLDRFLADPAQFVPGTSMPVNVADAADRADVIAFLATTE